MNPTLDDLSYPELLLWQERWGDLPPRYAEKLSAWLADHPEARNVAYPSTHRQTEREESRALAAEARRVMDKNRDAIAGERKKRPPARIAHARWRLKAQAVAGGRSVEEVAVMFQCSRHSVRQAMAAMGVPAPHPECWPGRYVDASVKPRRSPAGTNQPEARRSRVA